MYRVAAGRMNHSAIGAWCAAGESNPALSGFSRVCLPEDTCCTWWTRRVLTPLPLPCRGSDLPMIYTSIVLLAPSPGVEPGPGSPLSGRHHSFPTCLPVRTLHHEENGSVDWWPVSLCRPELMALERVEEIESSSSPWQGDVLPLYDTRKMVGQRESNPLNKKVRPVGHDSRGRSCNTLTCWRQRLCASPENRTPVDRVRTGESAIDLERQDGRPRGIRTHMVRLKRAVHFHYARDPWLLGRASNPHARRRHINSVLRLPISPPRNETMLLGSPM